MRWMHIKHAVLHVWCTLHYTTESTVVFFFFFEMEVVSRSAVWLFDPAQARVDYTSTKELRLILEGLEGRKLCPRIPMESIRDLITYVHAEECLTADWLREVTRNDVQDVQVVVYRPLRKIMAMGVVVPEACKMSVNGKNCTVAVRFAGSRTEEPEDCPIHHCHARGAPLADDDPHWVRWQEEYAAKLRAAQDVPPPSANPTAPELLPNGGGGARKTGGGAAGRKKARAWKSGRPLFPCFDEEEQRQEDCMRAREKHGQEVYHSSRFLPVGIKRRFVDALDEIGAYERNRAAELYDEILEENEALRAELRELKSGGRTL